VHDVLLVVQDHLLEAQLLLLPLCPLVLQSWSEYLIQEPPFMSHLISQSWLLLHLSQMVLQCRQLMVLYATLLIRVLFVIHTLQYLIFSLFLSYLWTFFQ
jgi:hypothetical protein